MANYTNRNPDKTFEVVIRDYPFLLYLLHKPKIHAKIDAIFYRKNTFHNNLQFIFKYRHKTSIADWIEFQLLNKNYNKVDIIILEEKLIGKKTLLMNMEQNYMKLLKIQLYLKIEDLLKKIC